MIAEALSTLLSGSMLDVETAEGCMDEIMSGVVPAAQVSAYLVLLSRNGLSVEVVTGSARAMRKHATPIVSKRTPLLDTCGTGGDGVGSFNISTLAALVVASSGVPVAKHGNRRSSSLCGSADVLEALGVNVNLSPEQVGACIDEVGIGFLFAQQLHGSMKHAALVRRELGMPTIFNMLGPLTNPASAQYQLLGVAKKEWLPLVAHALLHLETRKSWVVLGDGGVDEMTPCGLVEVMEVSDGQVKHFMLDPMDYGIPHYSLVELQGGDATENATIVHEVLNGVQGARYHTVLLNAAAALYLYGKAKDFGQGLSIAETALLSGAAKDKLAELITFSQGVIA